MDKVYRLLFVLVIGITYSNSYALAENDTLWKMLETDKNMIVLMRHAKTKAKSGNPLNWDKSGNCKNEKMLSAEGKAYAKKLAEQFKKRKIRPIVISSPMCRTRDTAKLAFGKKYITDPALREIASADENRRALFIDKSTELLIKNKGKEPIVFISHRPNVEALSFELVSVTELVVGRIDESGEIEVIGIIKL